MVTRAVLREHKVDDGRESRGALPHEAIDDVRRERRTDAAFRLAAGRRDGREHLCVLIRRLPHG